MDVNGDGTIGIDEYLLLQGRMKANKLREALSTAETSARSYNEHVNKLMGVGITLLLFGGTRAWGSAAAVATATARHDGDLFAITLQPAKLVVSL